MAEYFEDVAVGDTASFGSYEVTSEEIVSFASQYDPQPVHVDEEAAAESMFGGVIASGWHTAAMTMRLLVDNYFAGTRALAATGIDELRFREPVRPGDSLSVNAEVVDKERWDGDKGLVRSRVETRNQDEAVVMSMIGLVLWERREADASG